MTMSTSMCKLVYLNGMFYLQTDELHLSSVWLKHQYEVSLCTFPFVYLKAFVSFIFKFYFY